MSLNYHSRKYSLNESFFDTWSPTMAYVLGFWFADGYMRKEKSYRIVLTSNDRQILFSICKALKSSHPIRRHLRDNAWDVSICSKRIFERLTKLGCRRAKSKNLCFPIIPKSLLRDFIRGYFDGDGSVFFVKYTRTKDGKTTRELRTNFTSGSRKFLESLMGILQAELGFSIKKLGVFNNGGSLKLGYGMRDSDTLLRYMYYNGFPIGLERKAVFVKKIPDYQIHLSRKEKAPKQLAILGRNL